MATDKKNNISSNLDKKSNSKVKDNSIQDNKSDNKIIKEKKDIVKDVKSDSKKIIQESFDWESSLKNDYSDQERKKLEDIYTETLPSDSDSGETIEGNIVGITEKEIIVNIGYKSDGVISKSEFKDKKDLKVGDKIDVLIYEKEDATGQLNLSYSKALTLKAWRLVNEAHDNETVVEGKIIHRTKGGMIVKVFDVIDCFLPGSQIDIKPIRDYDEYVGKELDFKIVKINHSFKNVVVSHKALIEQDIEKKKKVIISKLEKGQILEGTVKNITSYGVFVDLGGVDGLIHITDLSWGRVNHPNEIVQLDSKIRVVVLEFDEGKKRIQLGYKQLTDHPWDSLDEKIQVGSKISGKVVVIADYGAFIEITPGIEALLHVSEISWSTHLRSAGDFLSVGDEVEAMVLSLDRDEKKMSLSIKQLTTNPWDKIKEKYKIGTKYKAVVRNFEEFGIFVEIEEGVDGLIHKSDLSWTRVIKHPSEFTEIGVELDVVIKDIDIDDMKISLGVKQLEEDPLIKLQDNLQPGKKHKGKLIKMLGSGGVVLLDNGIEAFSPKSHLRKNDGSFILKEEKAEFVISEFNESDRKVVVSHANLHESEVAEKSDKKVSEKSDKKVSKKSDKKVSEKSDKKVSEKVDDKDAEKDEKKYKTKKSTKKKKNDKS